MNKKLTIYGLASLLASSTVVATAIIRSPKYNLKIKNVETLYATSLQGFSGNAPLISG